MKGTYNFYQNGVLVGSSENLITEEGRRHIMRYLAGLAGSVGGSIAVGIGTDVATTADQRLTFEFDRAIVTLSSVDFINNRLIFKGTLDKGIVGTIYEAGLFSETLSNEGRGYDSRVLFIFGNPSTTWTNSTYANTNNRLSTNALRISANASTSTTSTLSDIVMDLSGYSNADTFKIAFKPTNSFVTNFKIRFIGSDPTSYYERTITPSGTGYQISSFTKTDLTKVGTTVDYGDIRSVALVVTSGAGGTGSVDFDALRVEDVDTLDKTNILVSRTVLSSTIAKTDIVPMEVEYALDVTVT